MILSSYQSNIKSLDFRQNKAYGDLECIPSKACKCFSTKNPYPNAET